jgi:hypothetical protein
MRPRSAEPTSWGLALVITITLGAFAPSALAQIVSNGGFEIPLVAPGSATYTAGQSFGGWTVDLGSVSLDGECPFSGLQSARLSGTVHQDLNTIVGAQYTLSYARTCEFGCDSGCDAVGHGVFVSWGAETVLDFWTDGWARHSYIFVATDVTTRLSFRDYRDRSISLDDISVVPATQPRISLHIQPLEFYGNLLKFPDGTFIAERYGELYRLSSDGKFERKLAFDRTHPVPEVTAYNTYFNELLAPLADGGFFAELSIEIPLLGSVRRLARFDHDGRLVGVDASDRPYRAAAVGVQLPSGRVLIGASLVTSPNWAFALWGSGSYSWFPFGSTRGLALQGSKVVAAGNFSFSEPPTQTVALLRLNADLSLDSSFRPPLCMDVSQLAVQSDGRIIARGRLADAQGVFDSETSVFRLNADGTFERRLLQTSPDEWQTPTFGIETNGEVIVLNSPNGGSTGRFAKLWRYHPDGTLKETIMTQYRLQCCGGYGFDEIEFLADGSFLAHWLDDNAGPSGIYPHHWVGFKADGQPHLSFPPSPFNPFNHGRTYYLSVTNTLARHRYEIEESNDLVAWVRAFGSYYDAGGTGSIEGIPVAPTGFIMGQPMFFRAVETPPDF